MGHDIGDGTRANPFRRVGSLIYAAGERFQLNNHTPSYHLPLPTPMNSAEQTEKMLEAKRYFRRWEKTANRTSDHYCTLKCLLQPPITYVNRQVRAESLSLFYQINKIHFELDNFVLKGYHVRHNGMVIPADWWRAIGDDNLRLVRQLNVFGQCFDICSHRVLMIKYRKSQETKVEMTQSHTSLAASEDQKLTDYQREFVRWFEYKQLEREVLLREVLRKVEMDGISMEMLEHITALLEPALGGYLRDYSGLGGVRYDDDVTEADVADEGPDWSL